VIDEQDEHLVISNHIYEEVFGRKIINKTILHARYEGPQILDLTIEEGHGTPILSDAIVDVDLDSVRTLLKSGIAFHVVALLIMSQDDLRGIANNSQVLLDEGVGLDLVSGWLQNGTDLDSAILIIHREGVDLSRIGTSGKVGDFVGLMWASPNEIVSRIPKDAKILPWKPGRITQGMNFAWVDESGRNWEVRMHGPDINVQAGLNAASGWVLRVRRGREYMDGQGTFYRPESLFNQRSPYYNSTAANDTHIPIQQP
jgi:hypothetical protein